MANIPLKSIKFPGLSDTYTIPDTDIVAETYSSGSTYAVGDYCIYNNALYRCSTAITTAEAWTAGHWTAVAMANEVSQLNADLNDVEFAIYGKSSELPLTDVTTGKYIDSDGTIKNGGVYQYGFIAVNNGDTLVIDTTACADTIIVNVCDSAKAFIRNVCSWGNPNKYYINIASGESYVCLSVKTVDVALASIYLNNDSVDINYSDMQNALMDDAVLPSPKLAFVRYATGQLASSSNAYSYLFNENLPKYISATLASDTDTLCAIAFYSIKYTSDDAISSDTTTNGFMQSDSVRYHYGIITQGSKYHAVVPENCKTIIITTVKPSETVAAPTILFDSATVRNQMTSEKIMALNDDVLSGWRYIYHLGVSAVTDRSVVPEIPSQSVFDVRNAFNLGYKCIEANVHKTSDGYYVVTHGVNGNLGHDFDTLGGEDAYGTSISGNTLQYLQENFRYRSSVEAYRTDITTLEEFLNEASLYNMIVMAQYVDSDELDIIKGIMGTRFFIYGNARSIYDGPISEWLSYTTKAEILERCNEVKRPYIYSIANPTSFSDADLQDIINTLHQNGFYISSAYLSNENVEKYSKMGFDFIAITNTPEDKEIIFDGKKLVFNQDGTVSWVEATVM